MPSQDDDFQNEDEPPNAADYGIPPAPVASGFFNSFGALEPAPLPDARAQRSFREDTIGSQPFEINVPDKYRKHWERVPDNLKTIGVTMTGYTSARLTPPPAYEGKMYGESKCFSLLPQNSQKVLMSPQAGTTYCFVAECTTGLPNHIQTALYFWDSFSKKLQTQNRSPYVFPTTDIGLTICRTDRKTVTGLYAKGGVCPQELPFNNNVSQGGRDISMRNILQNRVNEQSDETRYPIKDVDIHLGILGVEFLNEDDEKKHVTFQVLMVTPPANFAMWQCVFEGLIPPRVGSQQYASLSARHVAMETALNEILNYEVVVNLGVMQQDFGSTDEYRLDHTGPLGVETILSPFQIPLKIQHVIRTQYPGANQIKISGMPRIEFMDEDDTVDWIKTLHDSINAKQRSGIKADMDLQRYNTLKDKSAFQDVEQEAVGGWPLHTSGDSTITAFGLPPCPLIMSFNSQGIPTDNQSVWFSSVGGRDALPELVSALMRAFTTSTSGPDVFPSIDCFLTDTRVANAVLLYSVYNTKRDPFKSLITVNSQKVWWEGFTKDMLIQKKIGTSVRNRLKNLENYVRGSIRHLEGMGAGRMFNSDTIDQMHDICTHQIDFADACLTNENSISNQMDESNKRVSKYMKSNRVYRGWYMIMYKITEINRKSFFLNPANLATLIETLNTQFQQKLGGTNVSWTNFFSTILIQSGNGHYQTDGEGGPMTDNGKPNGTGADNVLVKIGDLITTLYEITGTPETDRLYIAANGTRFTDTAWEQAAMATAGGGQLYTQPPSAITDRPITVTELRMSNTEPIVMNVCARGEAGMQIMSVSSCDPNKTGIRELLRKVKVTVPCLMTLCGNKRNQLRTQQEVNKTLSVVCPIMVPGSIVHVAKRSRTCFQDVVRDIHTGRSRPIEDKEAVAYSMVYSHMFGSFYVALTNRLNSVPFEINLPVQATMEWATFYIQQYTEGVMETAVLENLSRMIQGYTARGISWFMWIKTIEALARPVVFVEKEEIIKDLLIDIHADALPITAIPSVLVCLVSRTVDASWLMMAMITARALAVPVISWGGLNRFFQDDEPPSEAGVYMDEYTMIREFFIACIENHRFCPETDDDFDKNSNISCYITGDGRDTMMPLHENKGFLRLSHNSKEKPGDDICVFSRLSTRVQREEGAALFKDCHMGPEKCIYKNALRTSTTKALDLRGLGSEYIFCTEKHFRKMGLMGYFPGMKDYKSAEAPVFAKQVCFRDRDQIKSVGIGINAWAMLTLLSITGEIIVSPSASDLFAHGIVKHVLDNSPRGVTPGNIAATRSFNPNTDPIKLYLSETNRPPHFLRPHDEGFPVTGVLSIGKAIQQYLPEDLLHCTGLSSMAETLGCDILEVPSDALKSPYTPEPGVYYPFHIPTDDVEADKIYGYMQVNTESEDVMFYEEGVDGGELTRKSFLAWELHMNVKGYVLMPLIQRKGACIMVDIGTNEIPQVVLACLVAYPETGTMYNHVMNSYQGVVNAENMVVQVRPLETMQSLVKVGTVVYLNMEVIQDEHFGHASRKGKYLETRLNVPTMTHPVEGKLYVTGIYKRNRTRKRVASVSAVTFAVNPWDVRLLEKFEGDLDCIVKHLD